MEQEIVYYDYWRSHGINARSNKIYTARCSCGSVYTLPMLRKTKPEALLTFFD